MRRTIIYLLLALLACTPRVVRAVDVVLVPLATERNDIESALKALALKRYRRAVEILQGLLSGAEHDRSGIRDGRRKSEGYLVEVPQNFLIEGVLGEGALRENPEKAKDSLVGRRFLPLGQLAGLCLSHMPAEGVAVYRELYDDLAQTLLGRYHEHGDRLSLRRVAREFFLSSVGDDAAEIVGDTFFEDAQYRVALTWWRRVLSEYPESDLPEARLLAKVLHALRLDGDEKGYQATRRQFIARVPGGESLAAGLEAAVPLVPRAERPPVGGTSRWGCELTLARPRSLPPALLALDPVPASDGNLPPLSSGDGEPALLFSWDSGLWSRSGVAPESTQPRRRLSVRRRPRAVRPAVAHLPFIPLVDEDEVFLSGVFSLFRFDGKSGGGALTAAYEKPQVGLHHYLEGSDSDSALYTTTIWKKAWEMLPALADYSDKVLITHYISDQVEGARFMGYDITVDIPIRSLVAFDADTREVLWKTGKLTEGHRRSNPGNSDAQGSSKEPPFPEIEGLFPPGIELQRSQPLAGGDDQWLSGRDFSYTSPVIVKGGLVVGGGWVQKGFIHGALRALDIRTGELVWETLLAGAQVEPTMFGEMAREPFSGAITEEDGVVYYLTQMGAIAAVELETGYVLWLTTYDTIELVASFSHQAIRRELSWGPNALLLLGNVLLATPRDSDCLYAIDTATGPAGASAAGRILWRYWNEEDINNQSKKRDLLGFYKGRLYFTGSREVSALDLSSMDTHGYLGAGGEAVSLWDRLRRLSSPPPFGAFTMASTVKGPGVLTDSGVLYPDEEGIRLVDLDLESERALTSGPYRDSKWGSYPGRLQVGGAHILMTSRELISAYTLGR